MIQIYIIIEKVTPMDIQKALPGDFGIQTLKSTTSLLSILISITTVIVKVSQKKSEAPHLNVSKPSEHSLRRYTDTATFNKIYLLNTKPLVSYVTVYDDNDYFGWPLQLLCDRDTGKSYICKFKFMRHFFCSEVTDDIKFPI